jgi:hypothetical protein
MLPTSFEMYDFETYMSCLESKDPDSYLPFFKDFINTLENTCFPKSIVIGDVCRESSVTKYLVQHFKKQIKVGISNSTKIPFPKYMPITCFVIHGKTLMAKRDWIQSPWRYGSEVQYLKILDHYLSSDGMIFPQAKWENLLLILENLPNLKGISLENKILFANTKTKSIQTEPLSSDKLYPLYDEYLTSRGIVKLNWYQFDQKVEELSSNMPFHFSLYSSDIEGYDFR